MLVHKRAACSASQ